MKRKLEIEPRDAVLKRNGDQCRAVCEDGGWCCQLEAGHEGHHAALIVWGDAKTRESMRGIP